jgi:hypothetical protein
MKDENGGLLADSHILNKWKNYFSELLNVCRVSDVRQMGIHIAKPLILDPSPFEFETATADLKKCKLTGSGQILAEMIQAGGETLWSEIHKLINSIRSKEELPDQWKESIIVLIYKNGDETDCSDCRGISVLSTSYTILSNNLPSRLSPYVDNITGDHQCGFQHNRLTNDHIFCVCQMLEKK